MSAAARRKRATIATPLRADHRQKYMIESPSALLPLIKLTRFTDFSLLPTANAESLVMALGA
ncbi:MAG: hypothetical protein DMG05_11685 [Acidobacteria bacterium]|nr:MAG: hypothetical protein DMG05_11685 [Acidobacteriota bacterium]